MIDTVSAGAAKVSGGVTAAVGTAKMLGLTTAQWSIIAIIAGIVGMVGSLAVNILFQWLRHKTQEQHLAGLRRIELLKLKKMNRKNKE